MKNIKYFTKQILAAAVACSFGLASISNIYAEDVSSKAGFQTNLAGNIMQSVNEQAASALKKGSLGFFQYNAAKGDTSYGETILNKGIELSTAVANAGSYTDVNGNTYKIDKNVVTDVADENDAASLSNFAKTFNLLKEFNKLRTTDNNFPGLSSLSVSDSLMAAAETNANFSTEARYHWTGTGSMLSYMNVGENLAWGYTDPFEGWYTEEKADYDNKTAGAVTGHYTNICGSYVVTGIGSVYSSSFFGPIYSAAAQDFGASYSNYIGKTYTVDEYETRFSEYCSANGLQYDSSTGTVSIPVTSVTINASSLALDTGSSGTVTAAAEPSNATNTSITWKSSNPAVATVSSGKIYGVSQGTSVITASSNNGKTATCVVTVKDVAVASVTLSQNQLDLSVGSTQNITAGILPENATNKSVTWSSSDPSVASVSSVGTITGKSVGTATVTAAASNGITASCTVTVKIQPQEMYRVYNPNSGEHFYTKDSNERDHLVSLGWIYEGVGWKAPSSSGTPVYRVYNPNAGDHHYTMNANEKDSLVAVGWIYEGIGWYSDDAKTVPLYRQYNPNAVAGAHNYTVNANERDMLVGAGWSDEGIGWYGM